MAINEGKQISVYATGGGKTVLLQAGAIVAHARGEIGICLIIVPTKVLVEQQVSADSGEWNGNSTEMDAAGPVSGFRGGAGSGGGSGFTDKATDPTVAFSTFFRLRELTATVAPTAKIAGATVAIVSSLLSMLQDVYRLVLVLHWTTSVARLIRCTGEACVRGGADS
ncbi:hypothetical protein B0H16DRAFT_1456795 [Mycena metata]|uniref:Uncharacterized protein n=1 Tax=Mycena metata TaxID=1033252 RepID=A0AAD7J942_9AGAR|nr:hypothetical protein B0H16DRAFT_1456795 [Mycena metata]